MQGLLSQQIKNSMLRCSTSTPVHVGDPRNHGLLAPWSTLCANDSRVLDLRFFYLIRDYGDLSPEKKRDEEHAVLDHECSPVKKRGLPSVSANFFLSELNF